MTTTLYWHDYETFGANPRADRPAQFAGVRTDEALNEIGKPLVIYCKPPRDILPQPAACLITGITPQLTDTQGLPESEFIDKIHTELVRPGTCGSGYNTLRFDDEVTRHTLYRNFFDPYAREWQNGNTRWDIIDLVRMTYALRPSGIEWPQREAQQEKQTEHDVVNLVPSFRLEDLTAANGIMHGAAHDALSDVRATIGLARLLHNRQPRLYHWLFQLRYKRRAVELLDVARHTPVVHSSRMYPAKTGCTTLVMPLAVETDNQNSFLVYDLRHDPEEFLDLDIAALSQLLFTRTGDLPDGARRLPVKSVKVNKCPALAPRNTLNAQAAEHIEIDLGSCQRHWQKLAGHCAQTDFAQRIALAYGSKTYELTGDVDLALYDGFIDQADVPLLAQIRRSSPQELAQARFDFHDRRLPELLFRYRARNWPATLSLEDTQRWQRLRRQRLLQTPGNDLTLDAYRAQIASLRHDNADNVKALEILDALSRWGNDLMNF
ncbi:exodeoxyribonuclease-1 [Nitrosomonas sp. Nm51]|nr:exodeoxyribonuclease-1 [Nitrosomonas sp. Nm51]